MIDIDRLKELVRLMVENDLTEIDLQSGEDAVGIKRGALVAPPMHAPVMQHAMPVGAPGHSAPAPAPADASADNQPAIESPMVGTFYSAADPDSPPFVQVGSVVNANDVVCIIEAMKVFNEIKAEKTGRITRLLVENGQPVEFGQKLFTLSPA